jgi:hypothetical protein
MKITRYYLESTLVTDTVLNHIIPCKVNILRDNRANS